MPVKNLYKPGTLGTSSANPELGTLSVIERKGYKWVCRPLANPSINVYIQMRHFVPLPDERPLQSPPSELT